MAPDVELQGRADADTIISALEFALVMCRASVADPTPAQVHAQLTAEFIRILGSEARVAHDTRPAGSHLLITLAVDDLARPREVREFSGCIVTSADIRDQWPIESSEILAAVELLSRAGLRPVVFVVQDAFHAAFMVRDLSPSPRCA